MADMIQKIKDYLLSFPRKKVIIAAVVCVIVLAILVGTSSGKKLSGSYMNEDDWRYEFLRTDSNRGEYGGTLNVYHEGGELYRSNSWYVEDDIVYIDGKESYQFNGQFLCGLYSQEGITVENGSRLSGSNDDFGDGDSGGVMFFPDGGAFYYVYKYYAGSYATWPEDEGTYTIKDDVVRVSDEYGNVELIFAIVNNEVFRNVLLPI